MWTFYLVVYVNKSEIYLEYTDPLVPNLRVECWSRYWIYHNSQLAFLQTFYHIRKGFVGMYSGYFRKLCRHHQL